MKIINKSRFVIETKLPTGKFANKEVDGFDEKGQPCRLTVPSEEPIYEYHWFAGFGQHPADPRVVGAVWTPYPSQGYQYTDRDAAVIVNDKLIGPAGGGEVIEVSLSHWREGRQVIVPVDAGGIVEGYSRDGFLGGKVL